MFQFITHFLSTFIRNKEAGQEFILVDFRQIEGVCSRCLALAQMSGVAQNIVVGNTIALPTCDVCSSYTITNQR